MEVSAADVGARPEERIFRINRNKKIQRRVEWEKEIRNVRS